MTTTSDEKKRRFLAVLNALLFAKEEPKASNGGQAVEAFQAVTGNKPPDPWCASLVAYAGHAAFGAEWPLPLTASCQRLYDWGKDHRRLVEPAEAQAGDLLLVWSPSLKRYAHIAVLTGPVTDGKVATIEGNTTDDGSREGWRCMRRTRTIKTQDALLRWVE